MKISRIAAPAGIRTGPVSLRRSRVSLGRWAMTAAVCRTSASFITSAAWNCSGPAPSQRRAPLTSTPMPGISTATSITKLPISSSGVMRRTVSRPCRESRCMQTSPTAP